MPEMSGPRLAQAGAGDLLMGKTGAALIRHGTASGQWSGTR
jgi:hypothetical protein